MRPSNVSEGLSAGSSVPQRSGAAGLNGPNQGRGMLGGLGALVTRFGSLVALLVICIVLSLASPYFLTASNILNVLLQSSTVGIMAVGMTMVIITGGIDLSVGSMEALGGGMAAFAMVKLGIPTIPSILLGLLVGFAAGQFSGFFVARFGFPEFIATLGMMSIARGLALIITEGQSIFGLPDAFRFLGQGYVGPIPTPVVCAALVFLGGHYVLSQTRFGVNVYAVGGNKEAAALSGINVGQVRRWVLTISATLAALAGIIMVSRLNSAQGTIGSADNMDVIAAVVIGGTSLKGGVGRLGGTVIGVLIIGCIRNGLNLLAVSSFWQQVAIGSIIIGAVLIDELRKRYTS